MEGLLEFKVLGVLRVRDNYLRYKDYVKLDLFRSPELQIIYKTIKGFHERNTVSLLPIKGLRLLLEQKMPSDEMPNFIPLLRRIRDATTKDDAIIRDCIIKFTQSSLIRSTFSDVAYAIEHDIESLDLEEIRAKIDEAINLGSNHQEKDYLYFSPEHSRLEDARGPIYFPTGISGDLDQYMGGGLCPGELGCILAPPGRGKTLALVNLGVGALSLGKRVLHITLEIKARVVGRRYDLRIARRTFEEVKEDPDFLDKKLKAIELTGARLLVKDYTYVRCTLGDLEVHLKRYQNKGEPFDMVILDYAALIKPSKSYKDKRSEIAGIYLELRNLAGAFDIPIWTASQANRKSIGKRVVGMDDIAESIDIANIADFIISICQSPEEKEELMARLFVVKTRGHSQNKFVPVISDPDRMLMRALKKGENSESDISNRSGADNWHSFTRSKGKKD